MMYPAAVTKSEKELLTYTQHVPGEAASEEFWGGAKHGLVYKLWAWLL